MLIKTVSCSRRSDTSLSSPKVKVLKSCCRERREVRDEKWRCRCFPARAGSTREKVTRRSTGNAGAREVKMCCNASAAQAWNEAVIL